MAKTKTYTQDQIARLLEDKRPQAATKFQETFFIKDGAAVSGSIGIGDKLYKFSKVDDKGYVIVENISTKKTVTLDPIQYTYADGGAKLQSDLQALQGGANPAAAGGGVGLQSIMSLGGTVMGAYGALQQASGSKAQKEAAKAAQKNGPGLSKAGWTENINNLPGTSQGPVTAESSFRLAQDNLNKARSNFDQAIQNYKANNPDHQLGNLREKWYELSNQRTQIATRFGGLDATNVASMPKPIQEELARINSQESAIFEKLHSVSELQSNFGNEYTVEAIKANKQLEISAANLTKAQAEFQSLKENLEWHEKGMQAHQEWRDKQTGIRNAKIKLGGTAIGGATSGYYLFDTVFDMARNGATFKSAISAAGAFTGLLVSLKMMHSTLMDVIGENFKFVDSTKLFTELKNMPILGKFVPQTLKFLSSTEGMFATAAAIITIAVILGMRKKNDELIAIEELNEDVEPVIWNNGPVMLLTAGLALSSMGINMGPMAPSYQAMSVPQIQLTKALENATGSSITDANRYSTVFVQQGEGNAPTRMLWVNRVGTDKRGNPIDKVEVFTFDGPVKFTNPGNNPYIPALITDATGKRIPNPAYARAIKNSKKLLDGAEKTKDTSDAEKATLGASGMNKGDAEFQ